jgi:hypothetical protein
MTTTSKVLVSAILFAVLLNGSATVSANALLGRYTITNGTVLDDQTKLVWIQTPAPSTMPWNDAKAYCTSLGSNLGFGLRLPTVKELLTIVDFSQPSPPLIDSVAFSTSSALTFWSGTPAQAPAGNAIYVDFNTGVSVSDAPTSLRAVRCVH